MLATSIKGASMEQITDDYLETVNAATSLDNVEQLCEKIARFKKEERELQDKIDELAASRKEEENKLIDALELSGKKKYSSNYGTFSIVTKFSVQTPKTPEDKEQFFAWLESKGIKNEVLNIHSATLNKLYNDELEASQNPDFKIPGIQEPTHYKYLNVRSK